MDVKVKRKDILFQTSDIDCDTSEENIRTAVRDATDISMEEIKIASLRPTRDGKQAAVVAIHADSAKRMKGTISIAIGWINCPVRE